MALIVDTPGARRLDYDRSRRSLLRRGLLLGNRLLTLELSTMSPKPSKTRAVKSPKKALLCLMLLLGHAMVDLIRSNENERRYRRLKRVPAGCKDAKAYSEA